MSKLVFRNFDHLVTIRGRTSFTLSRNLCYLFLQYSPFSSSSSAKSLGKSSIRSSFTVDYLVNSCGLTSKSALLASKHANFKVADNPDSVLAFFKDHGFTQNQISKVISCVPKVLLLIPEKTLLPKLQFLKSKGYSDSDVTVLITKWPDILLRSLEHQLIPSFNFFSNILEFSSAKNINASKRCVGVLLFDVEKHGQTNVDILKQAGVPFKNIGYLLANYPRVFMTACDKFRQIVDEVKRMGFDPSRLNFLIAVQVFRSMTKSTWDRKLEVYKKWGWSEKEIAAAFRIYPWCLNVSQNKLTSLMEFFVNKMECKSSFLATLPQVISLSLKKTIEPRCEVYQALVSKGLLEPSDVKLRALLKVSKKKFLEKFIDAYKDEAPELLNLYKRKSDLAK